MVPYWGRNVQEQNEDTRARILQIASSYRTEPLRYQWLNVFLSERHLRPTEGILVSLHHVPDQGGELRDGMWLTAERRFFQFSILFPSNGGAPEVEQWEEITEKMPVNARQPGTGKSFAKLALEVLDQW